VSVPEDERPEVATPKGSVYEFASDTFAIEAGTIALQAIGYVKRRKGARE